MRAGAREGCFYFRAPGERFIEAVFSTAHRIPFREKML
jgi:hypothetical protein